MSDLERRVKELEEQVAELRAAIQQPADEPADQLAAGFEQFRKRARKAAHGE